MKINETARRAIRTFAEAAIGYAAAHLTVTASGIADGSESLKTALILLITASVACGIAAVLNLPRGGSSCPDCAECKKIAGDKDGDPDKGGDVNGGV